MPLYGKSRSSRRHHKKKQSAGVPRGSDNQIQDADEIVYDELRVPPVDIHVVNLRVMPEYRRWANSDYGAKEDLKEKKRDCGCTFCKAIKKALGLKLAREKIGLYMNAAHSVAMEPVPEPECDAEQRLDFEMVNFRNSFLECVNSVVVEESPSHSR